MKSNLVIGSSQGTLGDSLWITPIFRAFPHCTLKMFDAPGCRNVSTIYEGIVDKIEFCEAPGVPPTTDDKTHVSQRMLNALGIPEASCIPYVIITEEEEKWATEFLKPYKNPIVFVNHNSGWNDPSNFFARHVKPPRKVMQALADYYRGHGYTIMQFCNAPKQLNPKYDNFDPLDDAIHIRGLTLRQQAACYKIIGKMITGDTGEPYLMLAVGGKFIMLLCQEVYDYHHYSIQYTDELWKSEKPRTKYYHFHEYEKIADHINFDF